MTACQDPGTINRRRKLEYLGLDSTSPPPTQRHHPIARAAHSQMGAASGHQMVAWDTNDGKETQRDTCASRCRLWLPVAVLTGLALLLRWCRAWLRGVDLHGVPVAILMFRAPFDNVCWLVPEEVLWPVRIAVHFWGEASRHVPDIPCTCLDARLMCLCRGRECCDVSSCVACFVRRGFGWKVPFAPCLERG